jgi:hypothetical protein
MKILISGASSKFAQKSAKILGSKGHNVKLVGRNTNPSFNLGNVHESSSLLQDVDVFLHFAHSNSENMDHDLNQIAADQLIQLTEKFRGLKSIYISSDSASSKAKSSYGTSKYRTERIFLRSFSWRVTRVGVILDEDIDSPYQMLKRFVKKARILIFPLAHDQRYTTVTCEEFVENCLQSLQNENFGGILSFCGSSRKSIISILADEGLRPHLVIALPNFVVLFACKFTGRIPKLSRISDSALSAISELDPYPDSQKS